MKLDILVFAAHPDDAELACSGTIISHIAQGKKVGIVDLTLGEMSTRGTVDIRRQEAKRSAEIMGLAIRENLELADVHFQNDEASQLAVVAKIRKYQPEIILANAVHDRHPDHGRASELVSQACFMSGLKKVEIDSQDGETVGPWRPKAIYHFIQSLFIKPDFVVDVSEYWEQKLESIRAFESQFHNPNSNEPATYISSPTFMKMIEARGSEFGHAIGATYGEGFTVERLLGVRNLFDLS